MKNHNIQDENSMEEVLTDEGKSFEIPRELKILITVPALILSLSILSLYVYLIIVDPDYIDVKPLGLTTLLIFCLTLILFSQFPYKKMGVRVTKIGVLELQEIVEEQSQDKSEEIGELQLKINDLEKRIEELVNNTGKEKQVSINLEKEGELETLLVDFLKDYHTSAFSPLRIHSWGGNKSNFEKLKNYDVKQIRSKLRELLGRGIVTTRLSKKGNTLYRIKK